ncbi:phospho-acceptor domain-containing protein [Stella humosa]|uniref:histidine kinase n=1 Tax=Stella humosa TaxID=94 RepID=A0A3N1LXA9_9PROT|nr:CHASE3 domain-containing protein [Stella humosa]ROP99823.1 phospho-acceptor domain-containing protein [Stella humosa]BBK30949.1 histidine kinase [Stella humosa]
MPITSTFFARTTILLLAAGALALLAIVAASLWLVDRTGEYTEQVLHAQQTRSASSGLLTLLQYAETGQRGYVITADTAYLEPYELGRTRIPEQLQRLRALFAGDATRLAQIERIAGLADEKMGELTQSVELVRTGRVADAVELVRTDRGKVVMDNLRDHLRELIGQIDRSIQTAAGNTRNSADALSWAVIAGALVIALLAGGSVWMSVRYTQDLVAARQEVQELNFSLEERVAERTSDLARANDEIQRFAYIVSHDLRAPLVNVMGFTSELEVSLDVLQRHVAETEKLVEPGQAIEARQAAFEDLPEALRFIRSSTTRMDRLINAILKLSREGRRTLTAERIDMGTMLETAAASVQHQLQSNDGSIIVEKPVPNILSDRLAVEQIFGNLVDNAVKYLDPARPGRIVVRGREQGGQLAYEIEDNGRGIAPQDHERIFELFRRSGVQDQPGEGIGLAHVRTLARRLGGDVTVDSALGRGTVFRVILPRRADGFAAAPGIAVERKTS